MNASNRQKSRRYLLVIAAEVIIFTAAALAIWYFRRVRDNFSQERDERGFLRDSPAFLNGPASGDTVERGRQLARVHCGGCHLLPEPELLPAAGWRPVLENMGVRLGLAHRLPDLKEQQAGLIAGLKTFQQYPERESLTPEEWRLLKKYYYAGAAPARTPPPQNWPPTALFAAGPQIRMKQTDVTMVRIDRERRGLYAGGMIHTANGPTGFLARFDSGLRETGREAFAAPPVALVLNPETRGGVLTTLGDPAGASVFPAQAWSLDAGGGKTLLAQKPLRMTQAGFLPLSTPARPALVLAGFGFFTGGLFIRPDPPGASEIALENEPGPIAFHVLDADGDGRQDLAVLNAQARERLALYRNTSAPGNQNSVPMGGAFLTREILANYHPAFGATGLTAGDFDSDGREDLVVVNGDNADFPDAPFKSYHGLRVYRNESKPGRIEFREIFFITIFGATNAVAADFDLDGDSDLAVVALYAPRAEERFVFLENRGGFAFAPWRLTLPAPDAVCGVIDQGDLDGDGDADLVLGALPFFSDPAGPGAAAGASERPVLFLLANQVRAGFAGNRSP